MTGMIGVISYGLGTIIGFVLVGMLVFWFIQDITQKKHTVLRNYPVIGRLRFLLEQMGEYFRQYLFAGDRAEPALPGAGWTPARADYRRIISKATATSSCRSAPPSTASAISTAFFAPTRRKSSHTSLKHSKSSCRRALNPARAEFCPRSR